MTHWQVDVRARIGTFELDVELSGGAGPLALIGPNGSGKTTLLRVIAGAITKADGAISVAGATWFDSRRGIALAPEERGVGYLPQGYGLFPHLNVLGNVAFGLSTGKRQEPRAERRERALAMLRALGAADLAERVPARLSGGERQRVALARALVIEPSLLLLDEPLAALDVGARRAVRTFIAERLRGLHCPSIVVTHDVRDVAALGTPTVCVLADGRVVQRGTLAELGAAPANDFVAEFVETQAVLLQ